jgi:cytochrome P450
MTAALVHACPREWSIQRILCEINTVMVPGGFGIAVVLTQALQDLCSHREYIPILRDEISGLLHDPVVDLEKLVFLECFIMESARLNCFETGVGRRKALKPFTFAGGHEVLPGEWLAFNQQSRLSSPAIFREPDQFNPHRFLKADDAGKMRYTDVSETWPIWGMKKLPCPGRFQAELVIKMTLVEVLRNWDFELDAGRYLNLNWGLFAIPNPMTKLSIRPRA